MNEINLNKVFPSLKESKSRLKELRCRKRELEIKFKMGAPMSDEEYLKLERIDADIEQVEYFIEWIEDRNSQWISVPHNGLVK